MSVFYKYGSGGGNKWLHKAYDIKGDTYGLISGRCDWMCHRKQAWNNRPMKGDRHPYFGFLEMDSFTIRTRGVWAIISAEYYGIEGPESEPVYELSNAAGEFPIESHPNWKDILEYSLLTDADVRDENGQFKGFPSEESHDYPSDAILAGVESYLGFGEVLWRKTWHTRHPPSESEVERTGKIDLPDGNPPAPSGRDWIKVTDSYSTKGLTHRRTQEWKLSGPRGANPKIYGNFD